MNRLPLRRSREGKTDYRKRSALLKSGRPVVVVRKSNKDFRVQYAVYDVTRKKKVNSAIGSELKKYG